MNYQQIPAAGPSRKFIRYFWALDDSGGDCSFKTFKVVPDGLPGLIFQENPKAFFDDRERVLPQVFLYGQTTKHTIHVAKQSFSNIGVYFQPTALKTIFGIDASELTNQQVDINDLIKSDLVDQLSDAPTTLKRIELLSSFFIKLANQKNIENGQANFAAARLVSGESLQHVQHKLNISERSLERYFQQHIGVSPKLYTRISRFQSALEGLRRDPSDRLTDIAYQNDYFDQSHFIRDFKEFVGITPKHFRVMVNELVANYPEWKI